MEKKRNKIGLIQAVLFQAFHTALNLLRPCENTGNVFRLENCELRNHDIIEEVQSIKMQ
jgi:hypothetical protein